MLRGDGLAALLPFFIGRVFVVAANFNLTTNKWVLGDFTYDGITNIADFSLVAANFNITLPSDLPRTDIPEAGALSALACVALLRRARFNWRD